MLTGANGMFTGIICKDITLQMKMESDRKDNIYLMKLNTFIITNNSEISQMHKMRGIENGMEYYLDDGETKDFMLESHIRMLSC